MKKLSIFSIICLGLVVVSCSDVKRKPGKVYMPDMAYSRAYETYADHSKLADEGINYNTRPVSGTIARGEAFPFHIAMDKPGDTTNYTLSKTVINPIDSLSKTEFTEAERLYLINCGICHGSKLDGNGPLYKGGDGPYPAAPKNLITLAMPDGQMFYSVQYGKNLMGSYAAQLSRKQRWQIIKYIKLKQEAAKAKAPAAAPTATPAK